MLAPGRSLTDYLFPLVLVVFLALYVLGLAAGSAPEMALLRATGGGLALAVLGRVARGILEAAPTPAPARVQPEQRGQHVDVAIDDEAAAGEEAAA